MFEMFEMFEGFEGLGLRRLKCLIRHLTDWSAR